MGKVLSLVLHSLLSCKASHEVSLLRDRLASGMNMQPGVCTLAGASQVCSPGSGSRAAMDLAGKMQLGKMQLESGAQLCAFN